MKTLWLDVDCGEDKANSGKGYRNKKEAATALAAFCDANDLGMPTIIVDSGGGLHCYWVFEHAVTSAEWLPVAQKVKELAERGAVKLLADKSRTAERASVLRIPGTRNHKPERAGAEVKLVRQSEAVIFNHFAEQVQAAWAALGQPNRERRISVVGGGAAVDETVNRLRERIEQKHPELWAGNWRQQVTDFGTSGYPSQSEADLALAGYIAREAVGIGMPDDALADAVAKVFARSGLYREKKWVAVQNHTIPKVVESAVQLRDQVSQVTGDAAGAELVSHEPGDILAGRQFAKMMRDKLLYVPQTGRWLRWDGVRWVWCACGEEMAAAKDVAGHIFDRASVLFKQEPEKCKRLLAFAMSLQNLKRLEAMVKLAISEAGMALGSVTELDSNPFFLGARNGVVNLKDGGLLAPDPSMLITRQVAADYHPTAQCPRWMEFLNQVFDGDADTIAFLQRAVGYTLTGSTTEEVLFICYGIGANGKSVFANVLTTILADYAQAAPPSLLTLRRDGDAGPRNDIARLCGVRAVQINELQQGDRLDEQVAKMLAGREMLSARYLHKEFFDFWPTAKAWLRTNHRPVVRGEDDGIWRRLYLIPFKRKFAETERDPWLESKLLEERDGILAWAVQGCLDWQRHGLKPSETIRKEWVAYRKESDLLGEFLDDKTIADPDGRVEQARLFDCWRFWCEQNGVRYGAKKTFTRKMHDRGFAEGRSNGTRYYSGLRLAQAGVAS
jgi:putative DNA primase/helicase